MCQIWVSDLARVVPICRENNPGLTVSTLFPRILLGYKLDSSHLRWSFGVASQCIFKDDRWHGADRRSQKKTPTRAFLSRGPE